MNPSKVVPRATLAAIAVVVGLYIGLQVASQGVLGGSLSGHQAPLAALAEDIVPGGYRILLIVAGLSMFATLQGDLLGSSRLLFALARRLPASNTISGIRASPSAAAGRCDACSSSSSSSRDINYPQGASERWL